MTALAGIRVLELGRVPPLELPGLMFSDMGADVIKVESPATECEMRDETRRYSHTNSGKRSVTIDLKSPAGLAAFLELARTADVIVEGFRPGVMQRLGADYEAVRSLNPRLVYCSMSGFGQTGPDRLRPAHDLNFLAQSGALGLWSSPGRSPDIPLNLVADYGGAAMHAALAIMFALFARERGASGQCIDIAYLDCTVALLAATPNVRQLLTQGHVPEAREGVFCGDFPYYTTYLTADSQLLAVACSEPHLWKNFCEAIGLSELAVHARQDDHYRRRTNALEDAAKTQVAKVLRERTASEWLEHFAERDACVTLVNSVAQMLADPQLIARGMVHRNDGQLAFGSPMRMSKTRPLARRPAPLPGEHTAEILANIERRKKETLHDDE